jgi:hypothetical protein
MMFEDENGKILMSNEVDELTPLEIEARGFHMIEE